MAEDKRRGLLTVVGDRLLDRSEGGLARGFTRLLAGSFGAAFEIVLGTSFVDLTQRRLRVFLDELGFDNAPPRALLTHEDFVHAFFAALRAAGVTRREPHVRLFARLVKSRLDRGRFTWTDTDDDLLATLGDLSYRELRLLAALDCYGADALDRAAEVLDTDADEVRSMLARLERTGCWRPGGEAAGGGLTARFRNLRDRIGLDLDELPAG